MKKFAYLLLALSIVGALLSGMLLLQHYYPDAKIGFISCGDGIINPCLSLAQSGYATLFRIPLAAYGLLWYLLAIFIVLIADYAGGRYYDYALAALLPLSAAAVATDAVLGAILIATGIFCTLCIATYVVNISILAIVLLWYRASVKDGRFSLAGICREVLAAQESSPDRRAFYSSFVLFIFLLTFAIFSTSYILRLKTGSARIPVDTINSFVISFYRSPAQNIAFPESGIVLGNPKADLTITVFTDFLCSACYEFYRMEKFLLSKYRDSIKIVYFNFPLDVGCNKDLKRTVYKNSCVAARAFMAASDSGILEGYIVKHFADYQNTHVRYTPETAMAAFRQLDAGARNGIDEQRFRELMNSDATSRRLEEHIRLAKQLGVDATPTLFINGRKMVGVPRIDILDRIMKNELTRKKYHSKS
ncbi:MAG: hypothetical protein A2176_07150 [Spirochaetes bacterium RBG_13_51_14]|nr:MAG: hypothetical protein A2176_07150 [Spirochaetes bacterium RBG_13_51_14]